MRASTLLSLLLLSACTAQGDSKDTGKAIDDTETDSGDDSDDTESEGPAPISDLSVSVHSSISTILMVAWTQEEEAGSSHVEYSFEEDIWASTPSRPVSVGAHQEPILGIPSETTVQLRVVQEVGDSPRLSDEGWSGTTGSLPTDLPLSTFVAWDPDKSSTEPWLLTTLDTGRDWYSGPWWLVILDRHARVVWYQEVPDQRLSVMSRVSPDQTHITWAEVDYFGTRPSSVERSTLDLGWQQSVTVPEIGYTYDELPDGTIAYDFWDRSRTGISLLSPEGKDSRLWECTDWLASEHSWWACGTNTVRWSQERESFMYSLYELNTVIEVDVNTGIIMGTWGDEGDNEILPSGVGLQMQHYPGWTPEGTLLLHTQQVGREREEWVREFSWNESQNSIEQSWSWSTTDYYADCSGEAVRLENGNTLINYGCGGGIREITPSGDVVWDVDTGRLIGHQTLIADLYALNQGR